MSGFTMYFFIGVPVVVALIVTIFAIALHKWMVAYTAASIVVFGGGLLLNILGLRHSATGGFWGIPHSAYDWSVQVGGAMLALACLIKLRNPWKQFRLWVKLKRTQRKERMAAERLAQTVAERKLQAEQATQPRFSTQMEDLGITK